MLFRSGVEYPFTFGVLLGIGGLFRANMLWLAPPCALASAWCATPAARPRVLATVLAGYVAVLAPWWLYKWAAFGSPAWDITRYVIWDQVQGRDWFEIYHRPSLPDVPSGWAAVTLLAHKVGDNLAGVLLPLFRGPRGLFLGALVAWLFTRPRRSLAAAALVLLAGLVLNVLAASVSVPLSRYVFPTRVLAGAGGLIALWSLLERMPNTRPRMRMAGIVAMTLLALVWGTVETVEVHREARATLRGVPASSTLTLLSRELNTVLTPGETVMSNLGPALAWQTNHAVIHLAASPADVPGCRQLHDFRHILLVFRDSERAWESWRPIVEQPGAAKLEPALSVMEERRYTTPDGFTVVWLQLAARSPSMAAALR